MYSRLRPGLDRVTRVCFSRSSRPAAALVRYRSTEAAQVDHNRRLDERAVAATRGGEPQLVAALPETHDACLNTGNTDDVNSTPTFQMGFDTGSSKGGRHLSSRGTSPSRDSVLTSSKDLEDQIRTEVNSRRPSSSKTRGSSSRLVADQTKGKLSSTRNLPGISDSSGPRGAAGARHRRFKSGPNELPVDSKRAGGDDRRGTPKVVPSGSPFDPERGGRPDGGGVGSSRHDKNNNTTAALRASPSTRTVPRSRKPSSTALPWENLDKLQETKGSLDPARMKQNAQRDKLDSLMGNTRYGGSPNLHRGAQRPSRRKKKVAVIAREVQIPPEPVSVSELGHILSKKTGDVMRALKRLGETRLTLESMIDPDTAELVAIELGLRTQRLVLKDWDVKRTSVSDECLDSLSPRPPVVTVMGHVDHGKTTLLDALRKAKDKVAGTEAAGITQKIGAFSVTVKDSTVTFFDTPGHAAFKSMRHSTSRLTDIVVVVVAADDGLKSQTLEVLGLLKEFPNLAPVVAVTKIDRHGVVEEKAVDRISRELLQHDVATEAYGGQVPIVPVSAVTGHGLDDLLEALLLQAEVMELRADDEASGEGVVVDSSIVKGRGGVADVLVSWGTLKVGDVMVAGMEYGRVRSMTSSDGKAVSEAGPSQPVRVVGLKGLSKMGDHVVVVDSEEQARSIVTQRLREEEKKQSSQQESALRDKRAMEEREQRLKQEAQKAVQQRERAIYRARVAARAARERGESDLKAAAEAEAAQEEAEAAITRAQEAERRAKAPHEDDDEDGPITLNAVFKAEGFGMLEAMSQVMGEVPQDEVRLNVIRTGVGPVTQTDVESAATAEAPIFAFNVKTVGPDVKALAHRKGVQIHLHDVIYRFLDDLRALMSTLLPPDRVESPVGEGEILEVFDTRGKKGEVVMIAGVSVSSGKLSRSHLFRVVRDGEVVREGLSASSMRRFKDRVNEVGKGKECGVGLEGFSDVQKGDILQCYSVEEVKRQL